MIRGDVSPGERISLWITCGRNENGRLSAPASEDLGEVRSLRADHLDLDRLLDVGMEHDNCIVLTNIAVRAFGLDHFALVDFQTLGGQGFGNVTRRDRAEQLAFRRGVDFDRDLGAVELGGTSLGAGEMLLSLGFVLGTTCFERFEVGGGRASGLASRKEEVTTVTRLDADLVAEVTEVLHLLEEDEFHGISLLFVSTEWAPCSQDGCPKCLNPGALTEAGGRRVIRRRGCRCTAAARGSERA